MKSIILTPKEVEELCIWPANPKRYTDYAEMSYSQGYWLKKLFYYPHIFDLYITLQHGIYRDNELYYPLYNPDVNDVLQDTDYFFSFNKRNNKYKHNIVVGSPFILFKERFNIKQDKNASGTLIFPSHSISKDDEDDIWSKSKIEKYINELKKLPKRFHPIVLCFYFRDVHKGYHKIFYENGFNITTVGHGSRYDFIPRFYNILKKFKYVSSNRMGSYVFYALDLGIPFFLYGGKGVVLIKNDLDKMFLNLNESITLEQKDLLKRYFGVLSDRENKFLVTAILYKEWFKHQYKFIKRKFSKFFLEYIFRSKKYLYLGDIEGHKKRYIEYLYQKKGDILIINSKEQFKNLKKFENRLNLIYVNINLNNNEEDELFLKELFEFLFKNTSKNGVIVMNYNKAIIKKVLVYYFENHYKMSLVFEHLIVIKKVN